MERCGPPGEFVFFGFGERFLGRVELRGRKLGTFVAFVCLFGWLVGWLFVVCLFVCLFVCSFVRSFVRSFVCLFVSF